MEWKLLLTVFGAVFIGASMALIATSALGVLAGGAIAQFVSPKALSLVTGIGFIAIGALTLVHFW